MVDPGNRFFFEDKALGPVDIWRLLQLENDGRWIRVFFFKLWVGAVFFWVSSTQLLYLKSNASGVENFQWIRLVVVGRAGEGEGSCPGISGLFILEVALLPRYPILGESPEVNSSQR